MIKAKFTEIDKIINHFDGQLVLYVEIIHYLQAAINLIYNLLSEIETSITFCKLGVLHPSIISTHVLESELSNIKMNLTNILTYEALIKVRCNIRPDKIIYFLKLPVYKVFSYHLYYLYSVPWIVNGSYATIVPRHKYLLKRDEHNEIIPMSSRCVYNEMFYCNLDLLSYANANCERNILTNDSTNDCLFTKLHITNNYLSLIPDTNYLIAVFPTEDHILVTSKTHAETLPLKGVHLINPQSDDIYYRDNLMSTKTTSIGRPLLLSLPPPDFSSLNLTHMSLKSDDVNLQKLDTFHLNLNPVRFDPDEINWYPSLSPSIWTILLYISVVSLFGYALFNYYQRKPTPNPVT